MAAEQGKQDVVELLLKYGADVKMADNFRVTALHVSANRGYQGIVELLLAHKAPVDKLKAGYGGGYSAFHSSVRKKHLQIAKLLLESVAYKIPSFVDLEVAAGIWNGAALDNPDYEAFYTAWLVAGFSAQALRDTFGAIH